MNRKFKRFNGGMNYENKLEYPFESSVNINKITLLKESDNRWCKYFVDINDIDSNGKSQSIFDDFFEYNIEQEVNSIIASIEINNILIPVPLNYIKRNIEMLLLDNINIFSYCLDDDFRQRLNFENITSDNHNIRYESEHGIEKFFLEAVENSVVVESNDVFFQLRNDFNEIIEKSKEITIIKLPTNTKSPKNIPVPKEFAMKNVLLLLSLGIQCNDKIMIEYHQNSVPDIQAAESILGLGDYDPEGQVMYDLFQDNTSKNTNKLELESRKYLNSKLLEYESKSENKEMEIDSENVESEDKEEINLGKNKRQYLNRALTQGHRHSDARKWCIESETNPNNLEERVIYQDIHLNETKLSSTMTDDNKKLIKIIFERKNYEKEWNTCKVFLFRLFITDTLHDFFDSFRKGERAHYLHDNLPKEFSLFWKEYIRNFLKIFPEFKDFDHEYNFIIDLLKIKNIDLLRQQLVALRKMGYSAIKSDLFIEKMVKNDFNKEFKRLDTSEVYTKTMIVDADKKSIQFHSILNAFEEQNDTVDKVINHFNERSPIVYMKTLSSELDQAATPKVDRILKTMSRDYFSSDIITDISAVSLDCGRNRGGSGSGSKRKPNSNNDDENKRHKETSKLHDVRVQMIKRTKQGEDIKETVFLDYEIKRTVACDVSIITLDEKIKFILGILHLFACDVESQSANIVSSFVPSRVVSKTTKVSQTTVHFVTEMLLYSSKLLSYGNISNVDTYVSNIINLVYQGEPTKIKSWRNGYKKAISDHKDRLAEQGGENWIRVSEGFFNSVIITNNDQLSLICNELIEFISRMINRNIDYTNTYNEFCENMKIYIDNDSSQLELKRLNTSKQTIDFEINNILGTEFNEPSWFSNLRREVNSQTTTNIEGNKMDDDDDDGGSFGVSKLCKWMVDTVGNRKNDKVHTYSTFIKPVFLKMNMDSFHYISLLEHKYQIESNAIATFARPTVLPIMSTFDINCGYLCCFFSQDILCLIENGGKSGGIRPNTYRKMRDVDVATKELTEDEKMRIRADKLRQQRAESDKQNKIDNAVYHDSQHWGGGTRKKNLRRTKKLTRRL